MGAGNGTRSGETVNKSLGNKTGNSNRNEHEETHNSDTGNNTFHTQKGKLGKIVLFECVPSVLCFRSSSLRLWEQFQPSEGFDSFGIVKQ